MQDSEDEYLREMTNKKWWHKKTCVESHIQPKSSGETFFFFKQERHFFGVFHWQRLWMLLLTLLWDCQLISLFYYELVEDVRDEIETKTTGDEVWGVKSFCLYVDQQLETKKRKEKRKTNHEKCVVKYSCFSYRADLRPGNQEAAQIHLSRWKSHSM